MLIFLYFEMEAVRMSDIGKRRRLYRLFSGKDRCIIVPVDDSLITGPKEGLFDLKKKIAQIEAASPNAILAFSGSANTINDLSLPVILNITASTTMGQHTNKVLVSSVRHAVSIGADAVAVHLNLSSKYESEMLKIAGVVSEECHKYGMPLMILAYPRCEKVKIEKTEDNNYEELRQTSTEMYTELVSHCVRIAYELGADIIKTQYTGSYESFKNVVASAPNTPIVIAGGKSVELDVLFHMIEDAIKAGCAGVSIGRNVFNNPYSDMIIASIKKIIFEDKSAIQAKKYYLESISMNN